MIKKYVALYYYVKFCLKNFFKNISFQIIYESFKSPSNSEKHSYNILGILLNIIYLLYSFKIIQHLSTIYLKQCYVNTLKIYVTLT